METNSQKANKFWVLIGILVLIGVISSCFNANSIDRSGIEAAIQDVVSQGLLNPNGAKFSNDSETTITDNKDDSYHVTGYVDCTNAFGATVRNNYDATVTKDGDNWRVEYELQNAFTGEWE